jgi:hypothetical protein
MVATDDISEAQATLDLSSFVREVVDLSSLARATADGPHSLLCRRGQCPGASLTVSPLEGREGMAQREGMSEGGWERDKKRQRAMVQDHWRR